VTTECDAKRHTKEAGISLSWRFARFSREGRRRGEGERQREAAREKQGTRHRHRRLCHRAATSIRCQRAKRCYDSIRVRLGRRRMSTGESTVCPVATPHRYAGSTLKRFARHVRESRFGPAARFYLLSASGIQRGAYRAPRRFDPRDTLLPHLVCFRQDHEMVRIQNVLAN